MIASGIKGRSQIVEKFRWHKQRLKNAPRLKTRFALIGAWWSAAHPTVATLGEAGGRESWRSLRPGRRADFLLRLSMVARTSAACLNDNIRDRWGGTRHVYVGRVCEHVARWRITEGYRDCAASKQDHGSGDSDKFRGDFSGQVIPICRPLKC